MLLLHLSDVDEAGWAEGFGTALGTYPVVRRGDDFDPAAVRYIFVWKPRPDAFDGLSGLKAVLSLGAGVDALLKHEQLPDVPVVRFVDEDLSQRMSDYVVAHVTMHHRLYTRFRADQKARRWSQLYPPAASETTVGIMGMGVLGQDAALSAVSNAIRRARAGLQDSRRPMGSFIFLGPTGVGKTELAKALAEFLFDDERAMVRIDMSEYMEKHSVARLIGAPPGYVGYEEGGYLTEAVRRRPYAVILFDEIEKAHPDVFNILLQILDDGRLTDGKGRTVDFKNTVIIMTSNIGSQAISESSGDLESAMPLLMESLRSTFRPEFLNRIDDVIVFKSLDLDDMDKIIDLVLDTVKTHVAPAGITLQFTPEAKKLLVKEGYDPDYGARPLRRVVQRMVEDRLSDEIIGGKIPHGTTVTVDVDPDAKGKLVFRVDG